MIAHEKLEFCPQCHEQGDNWHYDFQRCDTCGLDSMRPFAPLRTPAALTEPEPDPQPDNQSMADALAVAHCPEDVEEYGKRHGLPEFVKLVWVAAFQAGWRACDHKHNQTQQET